MTANSPDEKRLFDISSLDEWRTQAYENAKLFKEIVKRWHDKRIQKREFKVGEYVLLYNSRFRFFAGKLLSKWEGPYVIGRKYALEEIIKLLFIFPYIMINVYYSC